MYEAGVVVHFEAAHRLRGDFGPATRLHGHTYRVEITVFGRELRPDGTLFDLGRLQELSALVVAQLHYRDLDDLAAFAGRNTTAEVVAQHIFDELARSLRDSQVARLRVRVFESPAVFAGYEEAV